MQIFLFVLGVTLFVSLVLIHEWGHFLVARRNGVDVEEFGLGFPPRAKGKKLKKRHDFKLKLAATGWFCEAKGEYDADDRKGSFGAASLPAKSKILLAGVTMNLIAG